MTLLREDATRASGTHLRGPLSHLVEQLWAPALATGRVRLDLGSPPPPGWREVESYLVVPSAHRAALLLPHHPPHATAGALLNYRGLRRPATNAQRGLLGAVAQTGVPLPLPRLSLSTPTPSDPADDSLLPLAHLARRLGLDEVYTSIGIRTGANRKATLQLVDASGRPRGFAKLAWDPASSSGVRREQRALTDPAGSGSARAPRLLASGELNGWPYLVTEPLPLRSRGVRAGVPAPSPQELFGLCPLARRCRIADTGQFRALRDRVSGSSYDAAGRSVLELAADLLDAVARSDVEVPVTRRWHGDFTPWNCARDEDGSLWSWDWECSEPDAVAGLDAVHWHATTRTERGRALDGGVLHEAHVAAQGVLVAAGVPRSMHPRVTALYAATLAERACAWSTTGGWEREFVLPHQLVDLLTAARSLVDRT